MPEQDKPEPQKAGNTPRNQDQKPIVAKARSQVSKPRFPEGERYVLSRRGGNAEEV